MSTQETQDREILADLLFYHEVHEEYVHTTIAELLTRYSKVELKRMANEISEAAIFDGIPPKGPVQ
jgi:hypothetical protein